tara:strand:+ start:9695 stop:10546 length:852 start_codon:yes stop_codon:yes gene_type:complete
MTTNNFSDNADDNNLIKVATFYRFTKLNDLESLKEEMLNVAKTSNIKGTILIGEEGTNSTICGKSNDITNFLIYLQETSPIGEIDNIKYSYSNFWPFEKMKVKIKPEIVTIGFKDKESGYDVETGEYLNAEKWNELLDNPETVVLDTRNDYEYRMGTFKEAINPKIKAFRDFPQYVDENITDKEKPVAIFCTGGIRCEKASTYMKQQGFKKVYQLKGGILQYFEETNEENTKWDGRCFVFDDRIAIDQNSNSAGVPEDRIIYGKGFNNNPHNKNKKIDNQKTN